MTRSVYDNPFDFFISRFFYFGVSFFIAQIAHAILTLVSAWRKSREEAAAAQVAEEEEQQRREKEAARLALSQYNTAIFPWIQNPYLFNPQYAYYQYLALQQRQQ